MPSEEQKIHCPKCGTSISIDDALTHQISAKMRAEMADQQQAHEKAWAKQQAALEQERTRLEEEKRQSADTIAREVALKMEAEKSFFLKRAKEAAEENYAGEKKMLEEALAEKQAKLREANEKELAMRKERNQFEEERQNFELERERQLDLERAKIAEEASKKATEENRFVIAQLQKQLSDATRVNDDLARKLDQGSQQAQGEVFELELEASLKAAFVYDEILPVPKGVKGADIVQRVMDRSGRLSGHIVWELKNTKVWSEGWVQKLKEDQRLIKADVAVLISTVLPQGMKGGFVLHDGVWVCEMSMALALATALRLNLEALTHERAMSVGKNEKMEALYTYLTGVEFKQRVEAIIEAFTGMNDGLRKERLAYEKIWAEREKQINKVMTNTARMYGDLSAHAKLPTIQALALGEGTDP